MAGPVYGSGFVDLQPKLGAGFGASLTAQLGGPMKALGRGAATTFVAAFVAGGALAKIGGTFDDAFDTIRVGTGATAGALENLKDDFRAVIADVPTDFDSAGTAIADLNTRLGLTGKPLQAVSGQFLELSRLTKTDVSTNIESLTRTFGDWGIAGEETSGALDKLFRASQATGPPVGALGDLLVKFGAPLRQLGFGFEESAALLGKFEKEGVNTELVMGSMRIALGKMARDGEDAQSTFKRVTGEIANAGSASEANALALELFGARAGPDMAAAIREGRFEVGELFDVVANGEETIRGAAADTNDWRQSWQLLKNKVLLKLEPLATRVFDALGAGMDRVLPLIDRFGGVWGVVTAAFDRVRAVAEPVIAAVVDAVGRFRGDLETSGTTASAWAEKIAAVFAKIQPLIAAAMEAVTAIIGTAVKIVRGFWDRFGRHIMDFAQRAFGRMIEIIGGALDVVTGIFQAVTSLLKGDWSGFWNAIKKVLSGATSVITNVIVGAFDLVRTIFGAAIAAISQIWSFLWNSLKTAVATGVDHVVSMFRNLKDRASSLVSGMRDAVVDRINAMVDRVRGIKDRVVDFFRNSGTWLKDAGRKIIDGLIAGIRGKIDAIGDIAREAAQTVRDFFPFSPARRGPLSGSGSPDRAGANIIDMVAGGMRAETSQLAAAADAAARAAMVDLSAGRAGRLPSGTFAPVGGAAGAGSTVIEVSAPRNADERAIAQAVADVQWMQSRLVGSS